jgi:hypothetical protein
MVFSENDSGTVEVLAPWMDEPIQAKSFEEAYWAALALRSQPRKVIADAE